MKLSELVAYRELLEELRDNLNPHIIRDALDPVIHVVSSHTNQFPSVLTELQNTRNSAHQSLAEFMCQFDVLIGRVVDQITALEPAYLAASYRLYEEGSVYDSVEHVLDRRFGTSDQVTQYIQSRVQAHSHWMHAGMIIRPGRESWIEHMVACDPLYVIDHDPELMRPAINKFTPEYQRRLREYVINDWADGPVLDKLPNNQFGAIFAYHYFNHKPMPIICKFLDEFYKKLRPGGSVIMTYNNCDLAHGVIRSEHFWMLYTPRRLIEQHAINLGFELIEAYDGKGDVSWLEFKKPGDITSIRGGQTLAKIVANSQ